MNELVAKEMAVLLETLVFKVGKYRGTLVKDCTDVDYMVWYSQNVLKDASETIKGAFNLQLKNLGCILFEGEYHTIESLQNKVSLDIRREKVKASAKNGYPISVHITKSIGVLDTIDGVYGGVYYDKEQGLWLLWNSNKISDRFYCGARYALPIKNGKGKIVKGKTINITKYHIPTDNDEVSFYYHDLDKKLAIVVDDFEIIK